MKFMILAVGVSAICASCASAPTICPQYPLPSSNVLSTLQQLNNEEVDDWMIEQFKLNMKLKICNDLPIQPKK